jgi:hypothetical protein
MTFIKTESQARQQLEAAIESLVLDHDWFPANVNAAVMQVLWHIEEDDNYEYTD